ncbi:S41 family peptidase [Prolixibacteraceae bacterium]|nr:S41 family peptidase [Prolixibacteraceae bacterium]
MKRLLRLGFLFILLPYKILGQVQNKDIPAKKFLLEDYDYLVEALYETPPLLNRLINPRLFLEKTEKLRTTIDESLTTKDFHQIVLKTVALLNTKSARMVGDAGFGTFLKDGGHCFPFSIQYFSGKVYVGENYSSNKSLVRGTEILAINDIPTQTIIKELTPYIRVRHSGSIAQQLTYHWANLLWLHYDMNQTYKLDYLLPEGKEVQLAIIEGIHTKPKKRRTKESDLKLDVNTEQSTAILSIHRFYKGNRAFEAFIDSSFTIISDHNIEKLIIDVRENHGLSVRFIPALMDYLTDIPYIDSFATIVKSSLSVEECFTTHPAYVAALKAIKKDSCHNLYPIVTTLLTHDPGTETEIPSNYIAPTPHKKHRFDGHLYVLISHETYAEATTFASVIKDFQLGCLIGTETCNSACHYGLSIQIQMPHSKIQVQIPCSYTIRPSGDDDGKGVIPDHIIKTTIQDDIHHRDRVLNYTYDLITKKKR